MTPAELLSAIMTGNYDDMLDSLITTIAQRRKDLRNKRSILNQFALKEGMAVKIVNNIRPKYLAGQAATVKRITGNKILVELPYPLGRFGKTVNVPADLLEILKPTDVA